MIGEEAVEVAMSLGGAKAEEGAGVSSYVQEIGDLLAVYIMALEHGVLPRPDRRSTRDVGITELALEIA